ncbi:DUF924 family protein [Chitinivorax sp. PXF-14]|uniref:DUF924 family protein n=1 Tax=Chitinivorax sp. PXF-14 TaxID=3230488 RepID=UPI003467CE02
MTDAQAVLDFWFGPAAEPGYGQARPQWFRKDAAFDAEIRRRFGELHRQAVAGELDGWEAGPTTLLALIVVLDQFSRNLFRDDARAFAADAAARAAAEKMLERGWDSALLPVQRAFVYLPFEHAEDLAAQARSVALFRQLAAEPGDDGYLDFALRHQAVIERFGRFPHRNHALGRQSSATELAFLAEPGSSF